MRTAPLYQQRLAALNRPARFAFHGVHGQKAREPLAARVAAAVAAGKDLTDADFAKMADLEVAARTDPAARRTLNGLRIIATDNYLMASCNWMPQFANIVNLADDEVPQFQRTTAFEVPIVRLNAAGSARRVSFARNDIYSDQSPVILYRLNSERVEGPVYDAATGMVMESVLKTFDIAADLAAKVDKEVKTLQVSSLFYKDFTFTGAKADRTLFSHSYVNTSNLPLRNNCNLILTATVIDICNVVLKYCDSFGRGTFRDGDLRPTGTIMVPSSETTRYLTALTAASTFGQVSDLANHMQAEGYITFRYAGVTWVLLPDVTLAPGTCYPVLNKPAVHVFFKPGLDAQVQTPDTVDLEKNIFTRQQGKFMGGYFEERQILNSLKIGYTAANSGAATSLFP